MAHLIVGAGYTARFLYQQLSHQSTVYTLSRSQSFLNNTLHFSANLDEVESLSLLESIDEKQLNIYYLAPPKPEGLDESRVQHFILALNKLKLPLNIVYISTSGVYGNRNGDWVDEQVPAKPETDRAKRRVSAENQVLALNQQPTISSMVLRVPGIYGPGRLPVEKIKQRNQIISEEECGFTNLIHVIDLSSICIAAIEKGNSGEIYNVSDTQPIKSSAYYKYVAELAELPKPEEVSYKTALATFDSKRLSFLQESRRLVVDKMLTTLQPKLQFTDVKKGIQQALKSYD